jgi:hypothetical protein
MTDQELQGEKIIMEINDVKCVNCGHPITEFCQELLPFIKSMFTDVLWKKLKRPSNEAGRY